jgi:hypothetical protein
MSCGGAGPPSLRSCQQLTVPFRGHKLFSLPNGQLSRFFGRTARRAAGVLQASNVQPYRGLRFRSQAAHCLFVNVSGFYYHEGIVLIFRDTA